MFGIGMPEMLLLLAVALIVFGPKKLPELAKSLGRALGEFKRATSDLKETIESETGINEVRDNFKDVAKEINTPAKMAGDLPDPAPTESDDAAPAPAEDAAPDDPGAPMDRVKKAFDDLNAVPEAPAENAKTEETGTSDHTTRKPQDDPNP